MNDALGYAQALLRGERTVLAALHETLAALRAAHARLNCVSLWTPGVAEAQAAVLQAELAACSSDAERAALRQRRPFFGVPLLLKDVGPATAHPQVPSRMGSRLFGEGGQVWPAMGTLAERYLAAGFVPIGRSTSPEFGISPSTEAAAYGGPTRNPWHPAHSAGGSSGGAAAALASGAVPIVHANDGAGSIRIPAACCGVIGLKPTRGLMPNGPLVGEGWGGLTIDHVLTRTVRDCAAALDATAGADAGAPYAGPGRPASYLAAMAEPPPRRLRVGLIDRTFDGDAIHADVAAAIRALGQRLQSLGHAVEVATLPFGTLDVVRPVMHLVGAGTSMVLQGIERQRGRPIADGEIEPTTRGAYRLGATLTGADVLAAQAALHALGRRMAAWHQTYDLLLTPVLAEPPAPLGRWAMTNPDFLDYRIGPQGLWRYSPYAPLANATGAPAISVPAGLARDGLPIGAMLAAPFGEDALLLQVAAQLVPGEVAMPGR
ncbi:MAG: amidase [Rubrivivax sp.]|nr:amidase [Rubrivivax sp.]